MILEELIDFLEKQDQSAVCELGFCNAHSYRGIYAELAFEPANNVTVAAMLKCAKDAEGETFEGYKGGRYTMTALTEVHIAKYGACGESLSGTLLWYMVGANGTAPCWD